LDDRADWAPYEIVSLAVDKSDASKLIAVALRTAGSENIGQGRRCHFQIQSGGARRQLLAKGLSINKVVNCGSFFSDGWGNRVIPVSMERMTAQIDSRELGIGDFDALGIFIFV
jgi:hypothetical protein